MCLCILQSKSGRSLLLCWRNRYCHDISGHVATAANATVAKHTDVHIPARRSSAHFHCEVYQFLNTVLPGRWLGRGSGNDQPLLLWPLRSPDITPFDFFSLGMCQRPGIRPTIATWPRWPKGTDHCSSEEYRCTRVDACVARTWISYRCVPSNPWWKNRTSLVKKKKNFFQFSCGCEQFH
jgi:hypothetical protein